MSAATYETLTQRLLDLCRPHVDPRTLDELLVQAESAAQHKDLYDGTGSPAQLKAPRMHASAEELMSYTRVITYTGTRAAVENQVRRSLAPGWHTPGTPPGLPARLAIHVQDAPDDTPAK